MPQPATHPPRTHRVPVPETTQRPPRPLVERTLPSGRSVAITRDAAGERLAVCDPQGRLEVSIALTDAGPVVTVHGAARLELEAPRTLALRAERLEVETSDSVRVSAGGAIALATDRELQLEAREDVVVRGNPIRLN